MPLIKIQNTGEVIEASPAVSILNNLLRSGIRINHFCGGKAICGTCRIVILSGSENLNPAGEKEKLRLSSSGISTSETKVRLACQSYLSGDIEIRIPSLR